eukprot:gene12424-21295_t
MRAAAAAALLLLATRAVAVWVRSGDGLCVDSNGDAFDVKTCDPWCGATGAVCTASSTAGECRALCDRYSDCRSVNWLCDSLDCLCLMNYDAPWVSAPTHLPGECSGELSGSPGDPWTDAGATLSGQAAGSHANAPLASDAALRRQRRPDRRPEARHRAAHRRN